METSIIKDIEKIKKDIELIKNLLIVRDDEGELSDWARSELENARNESEETYTSLEHLREEIKNDL